MICKTVLSSIYAWLSAMTAMTRSPVVACSRLLQRQRERHGRRCAMTVERATTLSMKIAGVHATQCRQPDNECYHDTANSCCIRPNLSLLQTCYRFVSMLGHVLSFSIDITTRHNTNCYVRHCHRHNRSSRRDKMVQIPWLTCNIPAVFKKSETSL